MFERRLRTTWTLGLCLVLAGVACGRGGAADAQASPRTYVSTVCGAVLDWKSVIEVRSSALIGEDDSVANTTAYFNRVLGDTDAMVAGIRRAGTPELANGPALQNHLMGQATALRAALARSAHDTSLAADQVAAVKRVELTVTSEVSAVRAELPRSSDPVLSRAARAAFNCHQLFRKPPIGIGA